MSSAEDRQPPSAPWSELQEAGDAALGRQLALGNHDALAVIVDRYQRLVFSVAARIVKDEGEAEDVVQIVFLDLLRNMAKFDPSRGTLKMWVLQYAYSRSMNRRRHLECKQFYSRLELEDVDPVAYSTGLIQANRLSPGEASRLLEQAMVTLSPAQRKAIELCYFEGMKVPEAAAKMGHTAQSVHHHYYRGMMKIRTFLQSARSQDDEESPEVVPGAVRLEVSNAKPRTV
jgi:RNA polymerase sigma-70 factor (ECF subfamily)